MHHKMREYVRLDDGKLADGRQGIYLVLHSLDSNHANHMQIIKHIGR